MDSSVAAPKVHAAPWGKTLRWSSIALVAFTVLMFCFHAWSGAIGLAIGSWILPFVLLGALPFVIRSYAIAGDELLIRRLFWTTRLSLAGLKSAEVEPRAMSNSLRTFGNGGAFSFTGWFWKKPLGHYRAFVTDLNRTVVLRFEKRTVVVSPAEPEEFVRQLAPQPS